MPTCHISGSGSPRVSIGRGSIRETGVPIPVAGNYDQVESAEGGNRRTEGAAAAFALRPPERTMNRRTASNESIKHLAALCKHKLAIGMGTAI